MLMPLTIHLQLTLVISHWYLALFGWGCYSSTQSIQYPIHLVFVQLYASCWDGWQISFTLRAHENCHPNQLEAYNRTDRQIMQYCLCLACTWPALGGITMWYSQCLIIQWHAVSCNEHTVFCEFRAHGLLKSTHARCWNLHIQCEGSAHCLFL